MQIRLVNSIFTLVGIAIGIIIALQFQAKPVPFGSFPLEQLEIQRSLLITFSQEQTDLKKELQNIEIKLEEAKEIIKKRSSTKIQATLNRLKRLAGLTPEAGSGVRITLDDNPLVSRGDFSNINENFIQATDIRDLVNFLFLKDAKAIAINGKRILPLTPIQPVFDSILVDNFQISPPFKIEAIGIPNGLTEAVLPYKTRKIHIFVEIAEDLVIPALEGPRNTKFLSIANT